MELAPLSIIDPSEGYTIFLSDETILGYITDCDALYAELDNIQQIPGLSEELALNFSSLARDRALFNSYMSSDSSNWDETVTSYLAERGFRVGACSWSLSPDIMVGRPGDPIL